MPISTTKQKSNAIKNKLRKRLRWSLTGIFLFIFLGIIIINFFGPQVGALFGFISVHRNEQPKKAKISLFPPVITNLPTATNNQDVTVEGYGNPDIPIKIYINGPEKAQITTDSEGRFKFEKVKLINGRNTIFIKAEDPSTGESIKSETYTIILDTQKPKIDISEPSESATVKNLNRRITISGKVNEKATITINQKQAILKPDLTFEFQLGVKEGKVEIKITATDEAGNTNEESLNVKYVNDSD